MADASRALCLGEAMVVLRPESPGGLLGTRRLLCSVGGAEANVAGALAALGLETTWLSRLGADPFGDLVEQDLAGRGVRVLAERDRHRPTGAYLKHPGTSGSRMYYYRTGSAATAMDADLFDAPAVRHLLAGCGVVHTTGITAAVLAEGSRLLPRLVEERDRHGFVLSVDLNWRPSLWRQRDRRTLHELLAAADVLFLGTDEAEEALGTADPQRLRERLGGRSRLVLKSDAHVATESGPEDATTEVPALGVEVVEQVGAGDGFAAGYLTGLLEGRGPVGRLRLGHLVAAAVLSEPGDHVTRLPDAAARDLLLEATADEWRHTRVTVTGVESPALGTAGGAR